MKRHKRDCCVFTIMNNEHEFFPIWLNYYSKYFEPEDIYVLDHDSSGLFFENVKQKSIEGRFNLQRVYNYALFDHDWLRQTVTDFQHFLINSYRAVLFTEIDEIIATMPFTPFKDVNEYMHYFIAAEYKAMRADGFNVVSNPDIDKPINPKIPILRQRNKYKWDVSYCKPYISSIPLDYTGGFHNTFTEVEATGELFGMKEYLIDDKLIAFHLHYIDVNWSHEKNNRRAKDKWSKHDWDNHIGYQNKPKTFQDEKNLFLSNYQDSIEMPIFYRNIV